MRGERLRRAVSGVTRADQRAVLLLVIIPLVMFGIPTVLGHPPITQDNLIQNLPLRSLSGQMMRSGHLPVWNSLIFGGSPLLGAMNAGSFYPTTFAFVGLGDLAAWLVNVVTCYWAAGLGLYALARWLKVGPLPAFLGALTYAYLGMMTGQLVHLAVIQGQGWLPWVVLGVLVVADRLRGEGSPDALSGAVWSAGWPFVGLCVLVSMVFLTGEPRSIADLEIVALVVVPYAVAAPAARSGLVRRLVVVGLIGLAVAWGVAGAAAQLLPGQDFIDLSQRSSLSYWFFGSGSLALNRTILLAIPDFFGGVGMLHQPNFFVSYNISELNGYIGIIGLASLAAVLGALVGRRRRGQPLWLWLVSLLGVVGMVSAWGSFTPLGHVLHEVPLLGRTRLQSRNLVVVDLAAGMAVAWFVARLLAGDREGASLRRWRGWLTASPLVVTSMVALVAIIVPAASYGFWGVTPDQVDRGHFLLPWLVVPIALSIGLLVIMRAVNPARDRWVARWLSIVFALDAAVFLISTSTGLVGGHVPTKPSAAVAASQLGTTGRFALIDPFLAHEDQFVAIGKPDTNVFTGLPSVQGYGSLIGATYGEATGAHVQDGLDACQLAVGRFDQLRLKTMVMSAGSLAPSIGTPLVFNGAGTYLRLANRTCPTAPPVAHAGTRPFYFGQVLEVRSIFLAARSPSVMADARLAGSLQVSGIGPSGKRIPLTTTVSTSTRGWTISVSGRPLLGGLIVSGPVHKVMDTSAVVDVTGQVSSLGGIYQDALDAPAWRLERTEGSLQVFSRVAPLVPAVYVVGGKSRGTVDSSSAQPNGGEVDVVHLNRTATVVRSESMLSGWKAFVAPAGGGAERSVTVVPHDLVQSVTLPAGTWRVTFRYDAPGLSTGLELSALAIALLGLVIIVLVVGGSRRRTDRVRA